MDGMVGGFKGSTRLRVRGSRKLPAGYGLHHAKVFQEAVESSLVLSRDAEEFDPEVRPDDPPHRGEVYAKRGDYIR